MNKYAASSYDGYLCLKPPMLLWLAILYLSRALTLPIAMGVGSFAGVNHDAIALLQGLWSLPTLVPSLMAVSVLYAMCRRQPGASRAVRWIWAHGRAMLVASALLDCILSLMPLLGSGNIDDRIPPSLFVAGFDLYFAVYVLMAPRVRDTFAEFPPRVESH